MRRSSADPLGLGALVSSSWQITRGAKQNRVREMRGGARVAGTRRNVDTSPQRAKRQSSNGEHVVWTVVSISVRADDLRAIDARADELGVSRSAFLVRAGLADIPPK